MNRLASITTVTILFLLTISCQEEDTYVEGYEVVINDSTEVQWCREQNQRTYALMKKNYFWTEYLKDSASYDFSLEPGRFFESMLVEQDRFSYCYVNDEYIPSTRGTNLNETVSLDSIYVIENRRIGYFVYDEFDTEADITDIILKFRTSNINDLVIDLRSNPGGYVRTCRHLASLIVPQEHIGKLFAIYRYNSLRSTEMYEETGSPLRYEYLNDDRNTRQRNLNMRRLFCLVNGNSASCSELLINSLIPYMEVVAIGETTHGKDVGMEGYSNPNYKYVLWPIVFRTYNAIGDSVPMTGIIPDIYIRRNGLPLGDINESYLKTALDYIINNESYEK